MVEGRDRRVRAMPFGLWREPEHDDPGDEAAEPDDEGIAQGRAASVIGRDPSPRGEAGEKPAMAPRNTLDANWRAPEEERCADAADDADDGAQDDPLPQVGGVADSAAHRPKNPGEVHAYVSSARAMSSMP